MKTTHRSRHRTRGYTLFLAPGLLLSLLFLAVPLVMTFYFSLTSWQGIGSPVFTGLDNYANLLHDADFWASFRNIALVIVGIAVVPTLLGLFLSSLLFDYIGKKHGDRVVNLFRAGLYLPQVIPVAVSGLMWGWILAPEGAVNSLLGKVGLGGLAANWLGDPHLALWTVLAVLVWMQLGYPLVLFLSGLQRIDPELYEAAALDGASWWQRFVRITVPLLRPEVYVVLVTTTIAGLKVFAQIFVLTGGGPGNATLVPSYFAYQNFFERADVGYGSAISSTITVLVLVIAASFLTRQAREDG
ncbi:carbohydrate ABC transporter permease [Peterkaempfera sp. SMS 1(5)a]|uniref:carbohydrate ABC transporter permease n=1 Tax=Peterkaempfera podocarpi TaxID=3232308 RepID=UPI003672B374